MYDKHDRQFRKIYCDCDAAETAVNDLYPARMIASPWRAMENRKKGSIERGIGFFPTRGSVWSGRSMVGGVIKDLELPPYKLEKEQKCQERRKRT